MHKKCRTMLYRLMLIIGFLAITGIVNNVSAAPYSGDVFNLLQPDGSRVEVKVWGDEFYQRVESPDGYTLIRDSESGWICYAELSQDGSDFLSTGIIYNTNVKSSSVTKNLIKHLKLSADAIIDKVNKKRQEMNEAINSDMLLEASAQPKELTGSVLGLTLLIDFPDVPATMPQTEIENYVNQLGYNNFGCNGSIRDYFIDVSGGQIDYTNHVTAYYTAKHNKSYYTDESILYTFRANELVHEALTDLNSKGFDFSTLSTDANGRIRAINVLYAGEVDNGWGKGLWPHQFFTYMIFYADGVTSIKYQIVAIRDGLSLRTFCHENGHMLFGWPDFYDYDHDSNGIGNFGLMCGGGSSFNPVPPCTYLRYRAGWETVTDITDSSQGDVFTHVANSLTAFRFSHPTNPNEFFLIESRIQEGRNAALPDQGLMIWHIDDLKFGNNSQDMTCLSHYEASLEQADGLFEMENYINRGSNGDLFHAGYKDKFNSSTSPNSDWWCSGPSDLAIWNISNVGSSMTFSFGKPIVADAGPDQTIKNGIATLDGSGSYDPDGEIVSYEWLLNYRFSNNSETVTGETPTVTNLKKGFYDVTLTVTDTDDLTDTDTMVLTSCFISSAISSLMN